MTLSAPHQLRLRFFDLETVLRFDSQAHLEYFDQLYSHFRVDGISTPGQLVAEFALLTGSNNDWGQPVMILDSEVWPLHDANVPAGFFYDNILCNILAKIRSHFLLHAGVVTAKGQGIIIVADSFHGKTTLVLELVRRGFKFLSDDTAAIGRMDGRVHPFPRSLRIRRETLELTGFSNKLAKTPIGLERLTLDIEALKPGSLGEAAAISDIIILQNPDESMTPERSGSTTRELEVYIDRLDDTFLVAVESIESLLCLRVVIENDFPTLQFQTTREMYVLSQIELLCQQHRILMLNINNHQFERRPTFRASPYLETVSNSQATLELLRRFQGGHRSALLCEEFGGSSTQLYIELATLISNANCYRLFVGHLTEMADLVCDLVESPV